MIVVVKNNCKNSKGLDNYIEKYGNHFNSKLCQFALSLMNHSDKPDALTLDQVMTMLEKYKVHLDIKYPYDIYYVANMGFHDFYKSSIKDDEHLALFIKDYLEDEDGYEGVPFCRWLADIKHKDTDVNWEEML